VLSVRSQLVLAPQPSSVAVARAWVGDMLAAWKCDGFTDSARLVVSELVGNVVRHAPSDIELSLELDPSRLRIAVTDSGPETIRTAPVDPMAGNGRGLALVARVSDRWGVDYGDGGKSVWAEWTRDEAVAPTPGS
jgi:anti-sigma regulatory factor (Ser/Thr protein kinase)